MAINAKILLDPKFYYQKLREIAVKTKDGFGSMGSDIQKTFAAARRELSGADLSVKKLAKSFLLVGGPLVLLFKGIQAFREAVAHFAREKQEALIGRLSEFTGNQAMNEWLARRQQKRSSTNQSALSTLSGLQLSDGPLSNADRERQRQALETLRKSYQGIAADIDGATGKIRNFEEIQSKVLSTDQARELSNLRKQIRTLEEQNAEARKNLQNQGYKSDQIKQAEDRLGGDVTGRSLQIYRENVFKLADLRDQAMALSGTDRAGDAANLYRAEQADRAAEQARREAEAAREQARREEEAAREQARREEAVREDSRKYYEDAIGKLEEEIALQSLLDRGLSGEADQLRLILDLKKKGLALDGAALDRLLALKQEQRDRQFDRRQRSDAESLYDRALRATGRTQEADESAALKRAREIAGGELTADQAESVRKLAALTAEVGGLGRGLSLRGAEISTNSLTARGGFATGVRMPESEQLNRRIADYNRAQAETLARIEQICKTLGAF